MKEEMEILLSKVMLLFMRFGIKSLTMDDIARELKISKKTLYEYVKDKNALVEKAIEYHIENEKKLTCDIMSEKNNAIDEMLAISNHVSTNIKQIHPSIFYDLKKYHPSAWDTFIKYKTEHIYNCICDNFQKGVEQGLYRKDMNIPVLTKLYISKIDAMMNPDVFPSELFSAHEIYKEMMNYHIRGVASGKGIQYLNKVNSTI